MSRVRRPPVGQRRRTVPAEYIVTRYDEAVRRHPELTRTEIASEFFPGRKDPTRLIRKLRSGETSGRVVFREGRAPEVLRSRPGKPPPPKSSEPDLFTVIVRRGDDVYTRVNIKYGHKTRFDVYNIMDDPRVQTAVYHRMEERYPSDSVAGRTFSIDSVRRDAFQHRPALEITGRYRPA